MSNEWTGSRLSPVSPKTVTDWAQSYGLELESDGPGRYAMRVKPPPGYENPPALGGQAGIDACWDLMEKIKGGWKQYLWFYARMGAPYYFDGPCVPVLVGTLETSWYRAWEHAWHSHFPRQLVTREEVQEALDTRGAQCSWGPPDTWHFSYMPFAGIPWPLDGVMAREVASKEKP